MYHKTIIDAFQLYKVIIQITKTDLNPSVGKKWGAKETFSALLFCRLSYSFLLYSVIPQKRLALNHIITSDWSEAWVNYLFLYFEDFVKIKAWLHSLQQGENLCLGKFSISCFSQNMVCFGDLWKKSLFLTLPRRLDNLLIDTAFLIEVYNMCKATYLWHLHLVI